MKARHRIEPFILIILILSVWQVLSVSGFIPAYMLPSPLKVVKAFCMDFKLLMFHLGLTILEAAVGIFVSVLAGFLFAVVMDNFRFVHRMVYPLLIISQTVPTIALAPLLILWFGYGMASKVILIVISCFFPMTISLLSGYF